MAQAKSPLYTVTLNHRGGTYISQVTARDSTSALREWARVLEPGPISGFGPKRKLELIAAIERDLKDGYAPTPIDQVVNCWFTSARTGAGFMMIDIVKTDPR